MSENPTGSAPQAAQAQQPAQQAYVLGRRSKQRLTDCHPDMAAVVSRAIQITGVDFTVMETLRSERRQRHLVRNGDSWTKNSRHLAKVPKHAPELGPIAHAVDLGAWINGTINWDWVHYFVIADAMKQAAEELGIRIKWGGCWDYLDHYDNAEQAYHRYIERAKDQGKKIKADGFHFELSWEGYPV